MWRITFTLILLTTSLTFCQTFKKVDADTSKAKESGIYYSLPKTILTIEIPVTKVSWKMGRYFNKNAELSRGKHEQLKKLKGSHKDSTLIFYELGDIIISGHPVPDMSKVYFSTLKTSPLKNRKLTFVMNDLSVLQSADVLNEDKTFDIITQSISSIASLAGVVMGVSKSSEDGTDTIKIHENLLLKKLQTIRQSKFDLFTSPHVNSESVLNKQLSELEKMEAAIISEFTYFEEKKTSIFKVEIILSKADANKTIPLFKFTPESSIKFYQDTNLGYKNLYLNKGIKYLPDTSTDKTTFSLKIVTTVDQLYSKVGSSSTIKGIAYNIPAKTQLSIVENEKPIAVANMLIPQFGKVAQLSKKLSTAYIELDPLTGSLRKVIAERKGLSPDQIKAAGGAIETTAGLVVKKSETAQLEEEAKKLELKEKILKLNQSIDSLQNKND